MALNINQTQLDSFNKTVKSGHGTLVSNWHEEAQLRQETGDGRSKGFQHLRKKHEDLFSLPTDQVQIFKDAIVNRVDTTARLFGAPSPDAPPPPSRQKVAPTNPAESIPKVGRRAQMIEQQYLKQITDEIDHKSNQDHQTTQTRTFSTTNRSEFGHKNTFEAGNSVGKRVMKTQNGQPVLERDLDLLADHGFCSKPQLTSDEDLRKLLKQESYLNSQPLTIYTEKLNQGTFYGSKPIHEQRPFHKTDEFAKNFHHFTHIKN